MGYRCSRSRAGTTRTRIGTTLSLPVLAVAALAIAALAGAAVPASAGITIAAAANVQYAMEELNADFRKASGEESRTVYGASGTLASQIRNGAPFDVFVSADMAFPDSLAAWGYAAGKPRPYAYGTLVLWTTKRAAPPPGLASLADAATGRIALADPERAPYGREALKALRHAGAYPAVRDRLVYGESVSQVNQYVLLGAVDFGITAKSAVLAAPMRERGKWAEVDRSLYDPIAQGAVLCKHGADKNPAAAARFLDYLYSPPARAILAKYGYLLP